MKYLIPLVLSLFSGMSQAESLALFNYPDMFGESRLYLKNIGDSKITVLTENLVQTSVESSIEIQAPYTFVKVEGETIKLKQSIVKYSPVELNPGEITFLNSMLPKNAGNVSYSISKEFGEIHGTWSGTVKLK